jgi:hypothetical protein
LAGTAVSSIILIPALPTKVFIDIPAIYTL